MAMWVSALDDRIAAVISAGAAGKFQDSASRLISCGAQFFPGLLSYGDVPDVFCLIAPRPLMIMAGKADYETKVAKGRHDMIAKIKNAYEYSNSSDDFKYAVFEGGHVFNWPIAHAFLGKHLKNEN